MGILLCRYKWLAKKMNHYSYGARHDGTVQSSDEVKTEWDVREIARMSPTDKILVASLRASAHDCTSR